MSIERRLGKVTPNCGNYLIWVVPNILAKEGALGIHFHKGYGCSETENVG